MTIATTPFSRQKCVLTYFDIRGRAEPIRLLMEDAGIPYESLSSCPGMAYEDKRRFDWKAEKQNKEKYPFGQVPALSIGDFHIVQQDAIMRFVARETGYYGKTNNEATLIDMVAASVEDIRVPYTRACYGGDFERQKIDLLTMRIPDWLSNMNYFLSRQNEGKAYIAGESISFADFLVYEMIKCLVYLDEELLADLPLLQDYMNRIEARPNIKEYLGSGRRPNKVNNVDHGTPIEMLKMIESQ